MHSHYYTQLLYTAPAITINEIIIIIGFKIEFVHNVRSNNSLITMNHIGEGEEALFCLTDQKDCCVNESDIHGSWFLPNGSKILSTSYAHFYVTHGNQTVGLNRAENSSLMFPTGIYHCEMINKNNDTQYLYAGIYPENEGIHNYYTNYFCVLRLHAGSYM